MINSSRSSDRSWISAEDSDVIPLAVGGRCGVVSVAAAFDAESASVSWSVTASSMNAVNRADCDAGSDFDTRFTLPSRCWLKDSSGT